MRSALRRMEPTVKEILKRLDPTLADFNFDVMGGYLDALAAAERGIGINEDRDEWEENLAPEGPIMPADQLHPWVWDACRTFWESKHYRVAVSQAATAITARTQEKVNRRDVADDALMNQVFKDPPPTGKAYLRLPGDPADQTVRSRNRSLRPFAEGCFAGIRNPATHDNDEDWPEQLALEYLAVFSVLARWIDECEVCIGPL